MRFAVLACLFLAPSFDDWSEARAAFLKAISRSDPKGMGDAVRAVARDNSARAANLFLKGLKTPDAGHYWLIISGLARLEAKDAVEPVVRKILSGKGGVLSRDLMMSLRLNKSPAADEALIRVLKDGSVAVQFIAMTELVERGRKAAIPLLIDHLKKGGAEMKRRALKALRSITGFNFGDTARGWERWWTENEESFQVPDLEKKKGDRATVVESLRRNRTTDYEELKKGKKHEVVVVTGMFDQVQDVLQSLKIPRTVISRATLNTYDLSKASALLVNCDDFMMQNLPKATIEKIKGFVARGGYLFTSDWGLTDILERAFPGYVRSGGDIPPEITVGIVPHRGSAGHPFLEGAVKKLDSQWIIDSASFSIHPDPKKVVVLMESPELKKTYGHGAVAVTFQFGDGGKGDRGSVATGGTYEELGKLRGGKVLHVLSHFHRQQQGHDEFSLQNMLLNFLIEAKDRKLMKKK